jgi:hypothetical protein
MLIGFGTGVALAGIVAVALGGVGAAGVSQAVGMKGIAEAAGACAVGVPFAAGAAQEANRRLKASIRKARFFMICLFYRSRVDFQGTRSTDPSLQSA